MAKYTMEAIFKAIDKVSGPLRKIRASIAPVVKSFSGAVAAAKNFSAALQTVFPPFTALFSAAVIYKAVGGMRHLISSITTYGDEIAKCAERTGFGVEKLQELEYIAELSNVSAQEFSASLTIMNKFMGQMRAGTGTMISALKGVSPVLLKQIQAAETNEEAFELMIKAIRNVQDPAKKAYLATTFFGRSGQKMINMAVASEEAFKEMAEEVRRYGILSEKTAKESEEFQDELTRLQKAARGAGFSIAEKFLPALTPIITKLSEWLVKNRELIATKLGKYVEDIAAKLESLDFDKILTGIEKVIKGFVGFVSWAGGVKKALIVFLVIMNGPLIAALYSFGKAILFAGLAVVKFGFQMITVLVSPVGLIIMAILAVVAVIALLAYMIYKFWGPIKGFVAKLWGGIKSISVAVWEGIKAAAVAIWNGIKNFLVNLWGGLKAVSNAVWGGVKNNTLAVWESIANIAGVVWGGIKNFFSSLWESFKTGFFTAWEFIKKILSFTPYGLIIENWGGIVDVFAGIWESVTSGVVSAFTGIKDFIVGIIDWIWTHSGLDKLFKVIGKIKGWFSGDDDEEEAEIVANEPVAHKRGQSLIAPQGGAAQAEVVVRFDNMPRGAQASPASYSGGLDLGLETSYALPSGVR
jgi:phage-related protein